MDTLCGSQRYPYSIAGAFGKGWDNIYNYSYDLVWGLGHRTLPGTKVFLSNKSDFFRDFETSYGEQLPEVTLAYGNEWDLNLASLSEVSGKLKRSMEKLRTAETMAALVSVDNESMFEDLEQKKKDFLYGIGIYNLHSWTADGPISRHDFASFMRAQQKKVSRYVDTLYSLSVNKMGERINQDGLENLVFVFNPLNWERDGLVDIPLEEDFDCVRNTERGEMIEGQIIEKDGSKYLRVWLDRIPSTGYSVYQLCTQQVPGMNKNFKFIGDQLETPYYTVRISRSGAISSLIENRNQKEWVKGWLNDPGSKDHEQGEEIRIAEMGEDFITLLCQSGDPVKHSSLISFYANNPRIDISNTIHQNFDGLMHYSFSFNVNEPEVWHEEVGAVIKAKHASAGGHYADRMGRYDYLTLNHFVNVGNDQENISLSNADCLFFRLGNSTPERLDMKSSTIHVLAGGQVNKKENLGIEKQDGDTLFHQNFSLLPGEGAFDAGRSMSFALEHQNPLVSGYVQAGGDWSGKKHSFIENDNNRVILWTLKPGEQEGVTMRLWNMGPEPVETKTSFSHTIKKAVHATHVETDIAEIPSAGNTISLNLNQYQLKTYRLWLK